MSTVLCQYCNTPAVLIGGDAIYPHRKDLINKKFWLCKPCDAYVGAHKNSKRNAPLGLLANKELRNARLRAHFAFDALWKNGKMSRKDAYKWLADKMGCTAIDCHIAKFDINQCGVVVKIAKEYR